MLTTPNPKAGIRTLFGAPEPPLLESPHTLTVPSVCTAANAREVAAMLDTVTLPDARWYQRWSVLVVDTLTNGSTTYRGSKEFALRRRSQTQGLRLGTVTFAGKSAQRQILLYRSRGVRAAAS